VIASRLPPGSRADHGWLPAVVPAAAKRFSVSDPKVAATLEYAGAELVDRDADVEIASPEVVTGSAATVVVSLGAFTRDVESRVGRAAARLADAALVRREAERVRREVRRRGYRDVAVETWDLQHTLRVRGAGRASRRFVEYLPQRAIVIGRKGPPEPTVLDEAMVAAQRAFSSPLALGAPSLREGLLVGLGPEVVLRVALGPPARQAQRQVDVLRHIRASAAPTLDLSRLPQPLGAGRTGLGYWALETRLPGTKPAPALGEKIAEACVDFLVALHQSGQRCEPHAIATDALRVIERYPHVHESRLVAIAEHADAELEGVGRGYGHGDLFWGNLLVEGEELTGVIDWDAGRPGALPLVDLVHLLQQSEYRPLEHLWGRMVVEQVRPWLRAGGNAFTRKYCHRLGIDLSPKQLEAVVIAYWLGRLAYQLDIYADRVERTTWLRGNIDFVFDALGDWG
jgi:hypothetical protein